MKTRRTCDYCGLLITGSGYSPEGKQHFCCIGCYLVQRILGSRGEHGIATWILLRFGLGAFFAMNVMMGSLVLYLSAPGDLPPSTIKGIHLALFLLSTPAMLILGGPFIAGAIKDIKRKRLNTDALIVTGALTAYGVSVWHYFIGKGHVYFDTATMLLLIVTLGRLIEASAKTKTSHAIKEMISLIPDKARVYRSGKEVEIPASKVKKGDIMLVKPGERIPADGRIISGECMVEESVFTGESQPRYCRPRDIVYGGSVNCDGMISVTATAVGADSLITRMQRIVEDAQIERTPVERLAERVASFFVPLVWLAAAGTAIYWGVIYHNPERAGLSALAMLVVACPCALGIATPLATCIAIGKAAKSGVLIRSGEVLEQLHSVQSIFFDKTGTLTSNRLTVSDIRLAPGSVTLDEALRYATTLESASEHSIARAIVTAAQARGCAIGKVTDFKVFPGHGASGNVSLNGTAKQVTIGSLKLLAMEHTLPDELADYDNTGLLTTVYIGWDGKIHAAMKLKDNLLPTAQEAITSLKELGIATAVISGDREGPTTRLAEEAGINKSFFECTPIEKAEIIAKARKILKRPVAMVGDGINDAPALAEADVSIAIGGSTDLARQASDVTMMGDDLLRIPWVIGLSRTTYRIIRQNLLWAFGYNSIAMVLAFFGYVHPLIAATAMVVSSLMVIGNSMRILSKSE